MKAYRYRAARQDGRIVSGVIESPRAADVNALLLDRGLHTIAIDVSHELPTGTRAAPKRELAIVFRSLSSLVNAGVPLEKALAATEQVARGRLRGMLTGARQALREGRSLGQAFQAAGGLVPPIAVGMVRAGERGGRLGRALDEVANHLEQEAELIGRVKQSLAYPTLLAVMGTATVLVIATVVVPRFAELLEGVGQDLPAATNLLLGFSQLITRHGLLIGAVALTLIFAASEWLKRPASRLAWHRGLLGVPLVGRARQALATARTCRAMGGMLDAGMPLLPALDASGDATGDAAIAERLTRTRELVVQGATLAGSLERERVFLPAAHQLIAVGESSGQLGPMTIRAGDLAAREAERQIKTIVALLEPALIVIFGGLVAFVAAALLQAVYGLRAI